jgi:uncharacterized protein YneF (UPF0154 family)
LFSIPFSQSNPFTPSGNYKTFFSNSASFSGVSQFSISGSFSASSQFTSPLEGFSSLISLSISSETTINNESENQTFEETPDVNDDSSKGLLFWIWIILAAVGFLIIVAIVGVFLSKKIGSDNKDKDELNASLIRSTKSSYGL